MRMSSAFWLCTSPNIEAVRKMASGSSQWMWMRALCLLPLTTRLAPTVDSDSRRPRSSMTLSARATTKHSVQNRKSCPAATGMEPAIASSPSCTGATDSPLSPVCRKRSIPSSMSTKPCAPASTTSAERNSFSCPRVCSKAVRTRTSERSNKVPKSAAAELSARLFCKASANSRSTVRIVPSCGCINASRA